MPALVIDINTPSNFRERERKREREREREKERERERERERGRERGRERERERERERKQQGGIFFHSSSIPDSSCKYGQHTKSGSS